MGSFAGDWELRHLRRQHLKNTYLWTSELGSWPNWCNHSLRIFVAVFEAVYQDLDLKFSSATTSLLTDLGELSFQPLQSKCQHTHIQPWAYIHLQYLWLNFKATHHQAAVAGITALYWLTQALCIWKKMTSGARLNRKSLFLVATPSICYRRNYLRWEKELEVFQKTQT